MLDPILREERPAKLHDWNIVPKPKLSDAVFPSLVQKSRVQKGLAPITWTVSDIAKAGCLLSSPPLPATFDDEQEMRRVYTLIYDVFRYKHVLTQALNDVNFFQIFPKLEATSPHVWLLFYDFYHRSFKKRETSVATLASDLFQAAGLTYAENALWTQKVKLAAAVARLRIKNNALTLSELLPPHLKDERVSEQSRSSPVTCWVNVAKAGDPNKFTKEIEEVFKIKMSNTREISKNNFKWDRQCPQIIAFHASLRAHLAKSSFVKDHILIVQDKSFCYGPATFGKLISDLQLTGNVIQSHVNSPRTTAYLATLLSQNDKINKLLAFSAGKRKSEYESYFQDLGMKNVVIFSDKLIETRADANYMEEVVAVFATPPNSYSAVSDPIDLVCSRGGDLSMLEVLTEAADSKEAKERVASILEEQKKTLRFAMSRPQIQFVLYETHSEIDEENKSMVNKALNEMNRMAKLQHIRGKFGLPSIAEGQNDGTEINNNEALDATEDEEEEKENSVKRKPSVESQPSEETLNNDLKLLDKIKIPETDIFDNLDLPKACGECCSNCEKEGCYLALLQRKQIIRLDDKYMIQMAENRGLFGSNTTTTSTKSKTGRASKKLPEKVQQPKRSKRQLKDVENVETLTKSDVSELNFQNPPSQPESREQQSGSDVCPIKNILSKFSSAHIRQFVCPFYQQKDITVNVPSKTNCQTMNKMKSISDLRNTGRERKVVVKRPSTSSRWERSPGEKVKKKVVKLENILARITLPTQAVLTKITKEVICREAQDRRYETPKKIGI